MWLLEPRLGRLYSLSGEDRSTGPASPRTVFASARQRQGDRKRPLSHSRKKPMNPSLPSRPLANRTPVKSFQVSRRTFLQRVATVAALTGDRQSVAQGE